MSDGQTAWDENSARAWLRRSCSSMALVLRNAKASVVWITPAPLSDRYANLSSTPHGCLADTLAARERFHELIPGFGLVFHEEAPERPSDHFIGLGGPNHDLPVDLALLRLPPPVGYLIAKADLRTIQFLAVRNGLQISPQVARRIAAVT